MTNPQDRSPLDAVIDDVVSDMMQADARGNLTGRVLRSIEAPHHAGFSGAWFFGPPGLAAASVAVIVLVAAAMLLFPQPAPVAVPAIQVVAGPASALETAPAAPLVADLPGPLIPAPTASPAATSESIFGPGRGQVAAASVRPLPQVSLALVLSDGAREGQPLTQRLTMVLSNGERGEGRAGAAGEPQLRVSATPQLLASGAIRMRVAVLAPIARQLTVTLVPGRSTELLEAIDQASGRRITIDATVTLVDRPQR